MSAIDGILDDIDLVFERRVNRKAGSWEFMGIDIKFDCTLEVIDGMSAVI